MVGSSSLSAFDGYRHFRDPFARSEILTQNEQEVYSLSHFSSIFSHRMRDSTQTLLVVGLVDIANKLQTVTAIRPKYVIPLPHTVDRSPTAKENLGSRHSFELMQAWLVIASTMLMLPSRRYVNSRVGDIHVKRRLSSRDLIIYSKLPKSIADVALVSTLASCLAAAHESTIFDNASLHASSVYPCSGQNFDCFCDSLLSRPHFESPSVSQRSWLLFLPAKPRLQA